MAAMPLLSRRSLVLLLVALTVAWLAVDASGDDQQAGEGDAYNTGMCHKHTCSGGLDVQYPFFLANESTVMNGVPISTCGYPGMAVACDDATGTATLQLDLSSDSNYTVLDINYVNKTISLADADVLAAAGGCPRISRNMTTPPPALNFSDAANDYLSFFYGCAFTKAVPLPPRILPITCDGFIEEFPGKKSYLVPQHDTPPGDWFIRACEKVLVARVLKESLRAQARLGSDGYGQVLKQGFQLIWDPSAVGPCVQCEQSGGQCSYQSYEQGGAFLGCLCSNGRVGKPNCGSSSNSKNRLKTKRAVIIGTSVAAFVMLILLVVVSLMYIRKKRQYKMTSSSRLLYHTASGGTPRCSRGINSCDLESSSVRNLQTHQFAYEELEEATDGFSDARELGDGGFGTVYKGHLRDGRVVAVKRLYNSNSGRHVEQFMNEAAILSSLRHPNLVTLYGCTSSRSRELLLVYEFVANGTVADHLHGHRAAERALAWPLRLRVAVEAAAALTYLHAVEPPVVHRDVKTNNILLDGSFHVKVADFGLSRLFPPDATHVSTAPQGTPGYVDPEYHQCYQLTDKSDVYSFGVVLVELISSKPAVDVTRDRNEINLAGMAIKKIQKGQVDHLADADLGYGSDEATTRMMTMVAELAFRCLQQNSEMRPPIREVLDVLRGIQEAADGKKKDVAAEPRSPDTVHAPWDSMSTTPSVSYSIKSVD